MQIKMSFSGCSCGCVPPFSQEIAVSEETGARKIAAFLVVHTVQGQGFLERTRKCTVEGWDKLDPQVLQHFERFEQMLQRGNEIHRQINSPWRAPFIVREGYSLTNDQMLINAKDKRDFEEKKKALEQEFEVLKQDLKADGIGLFNMGNIWETCLL